MKKWPELADFRILPAGMHSVAQEYRNQLFVRVNPEGCAGEAKMTDAGRIKIFAAAGSSGSRRVKAHAPGLTLKLWVHGLRQKSSPSALRFAALPRI